MLEMMLKELEFLFLLKYTRKGCHLQLKVSFSGSKVCSLVTMAIGSIPARFAGIESKASGFETSRGLASDSWNCFRSSESSSYRKSFNWKVFTENLSLRDSKRPLHGSLADEHHWCCISDQKLTKIPNCNFRIRRLPQPPQWSRTPGPEVFLQKANW